MKLCTLGNILLNKYSSTSHCCSPFAYSPLPSSSQCSEVQKMSNNSKNGNLFNLDSTYSANNIYFTIIFIYIIWYRMAKKVQLSDFILVVRFVMSNINSRRMFRTCSMLKGTKLNNVQFLNLESSSIYPLRVHGS